MFVHQHLSGHHAHKLGLFISGLVLGIKQDYDFTQFRGLLGKTVKKSLIWTRSKLDLFLLQICSL